MLQKRNLYDPIEYMIKKMGKRQNFAANGGNGQKEKCMERVQPLDLKYTKGVLEKVVGEFFTITLIYGKGVLVQVIGECHSGYRLQLDLIYEKGILVHVEPTESGKNAFDTLPDEPEELDPDNKPA